MSHRSLRRHLRPGLGLGAALFAIALARPASAQTTTPPFAQPGVYVGFAGMFDFTFDGETFDGQTGYVAVSTGEEFILPKLDGQFQPRLVLGFRSTPAAFEFSYDRSRHDGTFAGVPAEATINVINVDFKLFGFTRRNVQPHALVGMSFPWMTVRNGSALDGRVDDATFRGSGLNLEGGVTFFATRQAGASLGYSYRFYWFTRVEGVGDETYRLDPKFRESSGSVILMGFYTF